MTYIVCRSQVQPTSSIKVVVCESIEVASHCTQTLVEKELKSKVVSSPEKIRWYCVEGVRAENSTKMFSM
jgi:hypothetical protein